MPPPTTAADAQTQLGEAVAVYLDDGPRPGPVPSTIVDLTGEAPRLLRQGAVPIWRLREVSPLLDAGADEGGEPPEPGEPLEPGEPPPGSEPRAESEPA
jgi:hypothetical protein